MPGPEPRQLVLDLAHPPSRAREDFIVGAANQAALALVEAWPRWPAPNLLVIGPPGAGKTHLAAIFMELSGALALPPEAGAEPTPPGAAAVVIDDLDRRAADETALFHLLNGLKEAGTGLLATATRPPAGWGVALPDLRSRLLAMPAVTIAEPDEALLAATMAKQFADRQIAVEPAVMAYLLARMERSFAAARATVEALDRLSLSERRAVTRALAARVLDGRAEAPEEGA